MKCVTSLLLTSIISDEMCDTSLLLTSIISDEMCDISIVNVDN